MNMIESGTLNDENIIEYVSNENKLIIEEFKKENVKQACYELRAGNIYFDLTGGGIRHEIKDDGEIVFRPHQTIVIISKEKFSLPKDILARFLTKGALFSIGFVPVNTYADPGFFGHMGIVMNNASNDYLRIPCGEAISKVEFVKLKYPVDEPYHGQHGFETGVWPLRNDLIIQKSEIKTFFPKENDIDEIRASYGDSVANIIHRVLVTERRFVIATIILIIVNLIIIGLSLGTSWLGPITNVICGIIANLGYAIVSSFVYSKKSKKESNN